jgi:mannosyltransferase OCH1-like enzyme
MVLGLIHRGNVVRKKKNVDVLPLRKERTMSKKKKVATDVIMVLKVLIIRFIKLLPRILPMSVLAFFAYGYGMSTYNSRNLVDPCIVAERSLYQIGLLQSSGRQLITASESGHEQEAITIIDPEGKPIVTNLQTRQITTQIPKIIHQQWKDKIIPEKFNKWRNIWLQLFPEPEYTYMLWDDETARNFIKENYAWFLETFDSYKYNIHRVDATRYFILYHYGGIYADLDYEPLINFYKYLPQTMVGIIESPYVWNEKTQNALMSSPKGDPFWIDLFHQLVENSKKKGILIVTGPRLMDAAIKRTNQPVYILPCENFQRVPLGEYSETNHRIMIERERRFRFQPLHGKHCGFYSDNKCQFGRHHNTASYVGTGGKIL